MEQKEILKIFIKEGFLFDKDVINIIKEMSDKDINIVFNYLIKNNINKKTINKNIILNIINKNKTILDLKKIDVDIFLKYFKNRYIFLKNILEKNNFKNIKSIRRFSINKENAEIIVMILNKKITKNNNIILEAEDLTGKINILINKSKEHLYNKCKNVLLDEVVAFSGVGNNNVFFADNIYYPDIELKDKKNIKEEVYAVFLSDLHVGSKMFLEENFLNFIKWINNEKNEDYIKKIKYLFLSGDNIDGVGVFPGQEGFLNIPDIYLQYKKLAEFLNLIRKDINIIICPGQHDGVWVGEPQNIIKKELAPDLFKMSNIKLLTNPGQINIEGLNILMYHGASFHSVLEENSDIRVKFKKNFPTIILKELLKRRCLAPTHGSCDYVPTREGDLHIINKVPDIIITGDLHRADVSVYNNILLISGSCWQSITPFEEKIGNIPDPCKVPLLNLKTREIKIMDFSKNQLKNE